MSLFDLQDVWGTQLNVLSTRRGFWEVRLPKSQQGSNLGFPLLRGKTSPSPPLNSRRRRRCPPAAAAADLRRKFVSGRFDEENPFMQNSSMLLVQPDEGVSVLVVDRIGDYLPQSTEKSRVLVIPVGARHKCQQESKNRNFDTVAGPPPCAAAPPSRNHECARRARWPCNDGLVQRDRCAIVGRRMAPRHERRSAAGCRCAHLLRDLPGVEAGRAGRRLSITRCAATRALTVREAAHSRALAARLRRTIALRWPAGFSPSCAAGQRTIAHVSTDVRAACALAVHVIFVGGGAAGRPPLPRGSGDVVTADLNSSRVWFEPVPGSR
ncbi:hypothetical protein F511_15493 [Dorcoceras hygrometricum]|uniref:Uncharacterized protein n=1 Tax=Dorcoceras hygrometricum TaxID=472368 RepID=A0A2Z7BHX6_9LAMI|nr:hypothetical protein F511_15493 [Dorcoceras hygrometricum]